MMTPPENVAFPIVKGVETEQDSKSLGPLRDSKSILVSAAIAPPAANASVDTAVTSATKARRQTPNLIPPVRAAFLDPAEARMILPDCASGSSRGGAAGALPPRPPPT